MTARSRTETTASTEAPSVRHDVTLLTEDDLYLFNEGSHAGLADKLGSHPVRVEDADGTYFAVWAPSAGGVSVIGDFNSWDPRAHPLRPRAQSGIWEGFAPGVHHGALYKFHIVRRDGGWRGDKTDPFAAKYEPAPRTASIVWDRSFEWSDAEWMANRGGRNSLTAPITVYEVHLGSWIRDPADPERLLTYTELAPRLSEYVNRMGFTHVEFLPVMEHPFYGSWGYQTTGYFAPSSRYGTPQEFMGLMEHLHRAGIGVILDWVPSHFPTDDFALGFFDGTHLFEHADPRLAIHPDWNSYIFNYARNEVRSFLISSAMHWLDAYHADGLRVDAVASMLYLDYSRKPGEWIPNEFGGRENIAAIEFMRRMNTSVYERHPDAQTVAEESTSWPMVSRPVHLGGLGFGMKWDMGWMHDTLEYMQHDPIHRRYHHNKLTFRQLYAFTENFVLPLSHDEVVHGKGSLVGKMPGDEWQKLANLRLLLGYMYAQPGKKLLFMGGELAQWREWNHDTGLDWHLLEDGRHAGIQQWVADLNGLVRSETALHELDCDPAGFEWVDANDSEGSAITLLRRDAGGGVVLVACNFTPVARHNYLVGVPVGGFWREIANSDAWMYGGSGQGNLGGAESLPFSVHGRPRAINLTLPPLGCVFLKPDGGP